MSLINGKFQGPAPTEHDGFEGSRFEQGEEVEVVLRDPEHGGEYGRAEGTIIQRQVGVDVSKDREDATRRKTLIQLKGLRIIQPETMEGSPYKEGEAWFAEDAVRKKDGDPLDHVSFN